MGNPCKHGHVDGVMHKPCPECADDFNHGVIEQLDAMVKSLQKNNNTLEHKVEAYERFLDKVVNLEIWTAADALRVKDGVTVKVPLLVARSDIDKHYMELVDELKAIES